MLGVKETMNKIETIDDEITGIERLVLGGTDENSLPNKGNKTQVLGKAVSQWWLMIDIQSTVNLIMNKELVKDIRNTHGRFIRVHCNAGTRIIMTEATLPGFGTVLFDGRCIAKIISLSKEKNKYCIIYDSAEGNQFNIVIPNK